MNNILGLAILAVGVVLLIGLGGIVRSWRGGGFRRLDGWGGPGLFPWVTAVTLLLVPVFYSISVLDLKIVKWEPGKH